MVRTGHGGLELLVHRGEVDGGEVCCKGRLFLLAQLGPVGQHVALPGGLDGLKQRRVRHIPDGRERDGRRGEERRKGERC